MHKVAFHANMSLTAGTVCSFGEKKKDEVNRKQII